MLGTGDGLSQRRGGWGKEEGWENDRFLKDASRGALVALGAKSGTEKWVGKARRRRVGKKRPHRCGVECEDFLLTVGWGVWWRKDEGRFE